MELPTTPATARRRSSPPQPASPALLVAGSAIGRFARRMRARHLLVLDLVGMAIAAYVALALRFETVPGPALLGPFLPILGLLIATRTAINSRFGLYSRGWRFASIPDVVRIVSAVVAGTLATLALYIVLVVLMAADMPPGFPRSFWPMEMLLSVAILGGVRFSIRAAYDWAPRSGAGATTAQHLTLLYGAGRTGVLMARSAERNPVAGVVPVGFLDDDPSLKGKIVAGLRVFGGGDRLARVAELTGARTLLITMPTAPGTVVRPVVDAALALGLEVRTVPPLTHLLDGSVDAARMRRVRVEDLLRRPIVTEHVAGVSEIVSDHTVLITGAAGSIGSELARQVFALGPRRLILVDRAESPLYLLQRELETRQGHGHAGIEVHTHLANITNRATMDKIISTEAPSVIFHAAAYKHVPMMEAHPSDAMYVNVGGTQAVLDAAAAAGVERFVLVSTDKAVRPSSVMGASKRVAEMLVTETARRTGRPYVSVRFGNVLGSNGSVVPIFQEQLENGDAADDHRPGHDPLLHDDPRGRLADPRCRRPRPGRATCSCSTWANRSGSWTSPTTWSGWPAGIPTASRTRSSGCGPARSSTRSCSMPRSTSSRPRTPRSSGRRPTCPSRRSATMSSG